jgi:hypothetical protein
MMYMVVGFIVFSSLLNDIRWDVQTPTDRVGGVGWPSIN